MANNQIDTPVDGPEEAQVFNLTYANPATMDEARVNAQELKDRFVAMKLDAVGTRTAAEYLSDWKKKRTSKGKAWVVALKSEFPALLEMLREEGLDGSLTITVAERGGLFELKRGPDKGKNREWKFASNEGRKKRVKKPRGSAILAEFGVK